MATSSPRPPSRSLLENAVEALPQEQERGNIEYKLRLVDPAPERIQHLCTQLKWRLREGHGEALYEIGVSDKGELIGINNDDWNATHETLSKMAQTLQADVSVVRERPVSTSASGEVLKVREVLFRKKLTDDQHFLEIRIAILGGAASGKSTLLGVLTHANLDNGRGKARLNLLRHRHEIESGRTSSISHSVIGFSPSGELINYASKHRNITTLEQICESSSKIVTFLDTCGSAKYLKTTISGLTGRAPDYACLLISANSGCVSEMTREHLALTVMLGVPCIIVLTKVDIAAEESLRGTVEGLLALLKSPGLSRVPLVVQNDDDISVATSGFVSDKIVPIFLTSSVTGENIQLLTKFFNLLPKHPKSHPTTERGELEITLDEVYSVPDVGAVIGGVVRSGHISISSTTSLPSLFIGPDYTGKFHPVVIPSIHRQRVPTRLVLQGEAASFALRFVGESSTSSLPKMRPRRRLSASPEHEKSIGKRKRGAPESSSTIQEGKQEQRDTIMAAKQTSTMKLGSGNSGQGENAGTFFFQGSGDSVTSSEHGSSVEDILSSLPLKLRKGQVLLSPEHPTLSIQPDGTAISQNAVMVFEADIHVLYTEYLIAEGICGTVHIGSVRQVAKVGRVTMLESENSTEGSEEEIKDSEQKVGEKDVGTRRIADEEDVDKTEEGRVSKTGVSISADEEDKQDKRRGSSQEPSLIEESEGPESPTKTRRITHEPFENWTSMVKTTEETHKQVTATSNGASSLRIGSPKRGLKTGDRGRVIFRFNEPEWIKAGWTVLFRDGRMKCVGKIRTVGMAADVPFK